MNMIKIKNKNLNFKVNIKFEKKVKKTFVIQNYLI